MLQWRKAGVGEVVDTPSLVDITVGDEQAIDPSTYLKRFLPLR
jgi:hypothetical protein